MFSNIVYFLQSVLIIAVVVGIIFAKDPLIIRVQQYFEFVFILYLPMFYLEYREQLVDRNKNTTLFIISYGIFLLLLVVPFVLQLSSNYGGIVPYMIYK